MGYFVTAAPGHEYRRWAVHTISEKRIPEGLKPKPARFFAEQAASRQCPVLMAEAGPAQEGRNSPAWMSEERLLLEEPAWASGSLPEFPFRMDGLVRGERVIHKQMNISAKFLPNQYTVVGTVRIPDWQVSSAHAVSRHLHGGGSCAPRCPLQPWGRLASVGHTWAM